MRVTAVDIVPISLTKDDPNWHFALGGTPASDGFVVRLTTDDGATGFGSCAAATYYGVSLGGLRAALELLGPTIVGRDPFDIEPIMGDLDRALKGHERGKAAIEIALHDLVARVLGIPLSTLLGGATRQSVAVIRILALNAPDEVADRAEALVGQGFSHLKIKLDGDVDLDVARVRAVRERVGPTISLTGDANQTYTVKSAIRALRAMEAHGLDLIEQPVAATDLKGLRAVREATSILVEADEAANTLNEIALLLDREAVDSINLKIAHVGGIRKARAAASLCEAAHVRCRMGGGTVGSRIVAAATLHLLAATPSLVEPSEVGEWARLQGDPARGLAVVDGRIAVPTGPGLGLDVDVATPAPASR